MMEKISPQKIGKNPNLNPNPENEISLSLDDFTLDLKDLSEIKFEENITEHNKESDISISILKDLEFNQIGQKKHRPREQEKSYESRRMNDNNFFKKNTPKNFSKKIGKYQLKEGIQNVKSRYERTVSKKRNDSRETVKPKKEKLRKSKKQPTSPKNFFFNQKKAMCYKSRSISKNVSKEKTYLENLIMEMNKSKDKNSFLELQSEMNKKSKKNNMKKIKKNSDLNFCTQLNLNSVRGSRMKFVTPKLRRDMQLQIYSGRDCSQNFKSKSIFQSLHNDYYTPNCKFGVKKEPKQKQHKSSITSPQNISKFDLKNKNKMMNKVRKPRKGFFFSMKKNFGANIKKKKDENKKDEKNEENFGESKRLMMKNSVSLKKFLGEVENDVKEKKTSWKKPNVSKRRYGNYFSKNKGKKSLSRKGKKLNSRRKGFESVRKKPKNDQSDHYKIKTFNDFLSASNFEKSNKRDENENK